MNKRFVHNREAFLSVRVTLKMKEKLEELGRRYDRSIADLVREAIWNYWIYDEYGKLRPYEQEKLKKDLEIEEKIEANNQKEEEIKNEKD